MTEVLDIEALRERFLNVDFDEQTFEVNAEQCVEYAIACGELAPRYTDPDHPEFQAPPTLPSSFHPGRRLPQDRRGLRLRLGAGLPRLDGFNAGGACCGPRSCELQ